MAAETPAPTHPAAFDRSLSSQTGQLGVESTAASERSQALGITERWVQRLTEQVSDAVRHGPITAVLEGAGSVRLTSAPALAKLGGSERTTALAKRSD